MIKRTKFSRTLTNYYLPLLSQSNPTRSNQNYFKYQIIFVPQIESKPAEHVSYRS